MIKLSICIFTYNRAECLRQALNSIYSNFEQLSLDRGLVEVVVSDNCSNDATASVVGEFKKILPITYSVNVTNLGADANLRIAASLARGEYIWFMADDDALIDEALMRVIKFLQCNDDVSYIYYPRLLTDNNLNIIEGGQQPKGIGHDIIFENGKDLFCSLDGQMPGILFYVSSTKIKRSVWEGAVNRFPANIEGFGHARPILSAIIDNKCAILDKPGILCRLYNHRDMSSRIWFDNYISIILFANQLGFSDDLCRRLIRQLSRRYQSTFVLDKARGDRNDNILSAASRIGCQYIINPFSLWIFLSIFPVKLLRLLLPLYKLRKFLQKDYAR